MNLFGTDGIRTRFGNSPLSISELINLGKAISFWIQTKSKNAKIILAHDTRISCSIIKSYLKAGLLESNIDIFDAEILATPAVYLLVQKLQLFDFGIMITASHNYYQDNGLKIIYNLNNKLDKKDELLISKFFFEKNFPIIDYDNLGRTFYYPKALNNYFGYIYKFFKKNFAKKIKIIIDCANGAASHFASEVFRYFGANVIEINNKPDGKNINYKCGAIDTNELKKCIIEEKADIGFAFDGDGDRVIVINKDGEIKDGDDILALLIKNPTYYTNTVVSSILCNYGLELYLKENNINIIKTDVGDKYIAQVLQKENLFIGAEPSGHIILRDFLNSSDAIFAALRIIETVILTDNWLIKTFDKFPQCLTNLKIKIKKDLNQEPFKSIIEKYKNKNKGKLIIRYSGTEPLLRILVESESLNIASEISNGIIADLKFMLEMEN